MVRATHPTSIIQGFPNSFLPRAIPCHRHCYGRTTELISHATRRKGMTDLPSSLLVFSGFITLLIGLLCGRPLVVAINRNQGEDKIRGWRVAHSSMIMGGIMLLVI